MALAKLDAWICDECGHVWLKSDKQPTHCASSKCRSRRWNSSARAQNTQAEAANVSNEHVTVANAHAAHVADAHEESRHVVYEEFA